MRVVDNLVMVDLDGPVEVESELVAFLERWWAQEQQHRGPCTFGSCGICGYGEGRGLV